MTERLECGDIGRLTRLLDDDLSADEQGILTVHLETCEVCRLELEGLAAGPRWWDELREAVRGCEVGEGPMVVRPGESIVEPEQASLGFLEPCNEPGVLARFGPYLILEVIGRGGMGVVLKAFDNVLGRPVAIKVLAPQLACSATARQRFMREARAAASVSHDHVVSIHAVNQINGLPFLVMPYISGKSLQDRIRQDGPLKLTEILRIGMQVARGIAAAHDQGLVHRDIKPANILLENGVERVKITDFGLALAADDPSLTRSGFVAGTPHYMAPEQARGEPVDFRADLYSLGSLLFTMCTGRPPFHEDSALTVLRRVSDERPPRIRQFRPDLPGWLELIIAKLHSRRPEARFKAAAVVAELLGQHLARIQQSSCKSGQALDMKARKSWRTVVAMAALAFLLIAGIGATESGGVTHLSDLVATVLRIRMPGGTLIVEVSEPDVKVLVDNETNEVIITGTGVHEVRLTPGKHQLQATRNGRTIRSEFITIVRGGKQLVKVDCESSLVTGPATKPLETASPKKKPPAAIDLVPSPEPTRSLADLDAKIWSMAYSPDGGCLIWGGDTKRLVVCEPPDGQPRVVDLGSSSNGIAYSPDGKTLAKCDASARVTIWDARSLRHLTTLNFQDGSIKTLTFSPDGRTLAAGGTERKVRIWDVGLRKEIEGPPRQSLTIAGLKYTPDGKTLVVATGDWEDYAIAGEVTLWDVASCESLGVLGGHIGRVAALAISPDGTRIATGCSDGVRLWDLVRRSVIATFRHPDRQVNALAFSPDGHLLAGGYNRGEVVLWDVASGVRSVVLKGHEGVVSALAFSRDGGTLVSGGFDKTLKFWDTATFIRRP